MVSIATWNVNSVRARLPHLLEYLAHEAPDILCLQELKCQDAQFPLEEVTAAGYHSAVFGQKTYNGVAILAKTPIEDVEKNLGDDDPQSRLIAGRVAGIRVVSIYAPNGQELESPAYQYKLGWYQKLKSRLEAWRDEPLIVAGDFNIAPAPIDTWDPELWEGQTLASPKERAALQELCSALGLTDLLRALHPTREKFFTWWDYRAGSFRQNHGLRIDHLLGNAAVHARCTEADVHVAPRKQKRPSDHTPAYVRLKSP